MGFQDRVDAGRQLAALLVKYANRPDALVLGLPRGGVPVAFEVAEALHLPLDVFIVRKIGVPGHEELAMGAIASGSVRVLNDEVIRQLRISPETIDVVSAYEAEEILRRERVYRGDVPPPRVAGRTVILVDDGLATGSTMKAAIAALRKQGAARIVVAVPVAPLSSCEEFRRIADEMVCVKAPEDFHAVSMWYEHFLQTTDDEVRDLMAAAMHAETKG
jgi:putative phosphoribosyl transferase